MSIIFENYVRMQNRIKLLAKKRYSFLYKYIPHKIKNFPFYHHVSPKISNVTRKKCIASTDIDGVAYFVEYLY